MLYVPTTLSGLVPFFWTLLGMSALIALCAATIGMVRVVRFGRRWYSRRRVRLAVPRWARTPT